MASWERERGAWEEEGNKSVDMVEAPLWNKNQPNFRILDFGIMCKISNMKEKLAKSHFEIAIFLSSKQWY